MSCVKDGPNNEERYREASLKIIHLLKQPTRDSGSLPELVRGIVRDNKLGRKFMYRVAQRSFGLLNNFAPWKKACDQSDEALGKALLQSGIVNIVNDQCASSTPKSSLFELAEKYKERWYRQIRNWQPELVVCGGTFDAIIQVLKRKPIKASTGMRWFKNSEVEQCIYLDAPHPTARYPVAMVYTYLMVSAREILGKS